MASSPEKTVRGYLISSPAKFIEQHYAGAEKQAILDRVPAETKELVPQLKDIEWYSRDHEVNYYRALVLFHYERGGEAEMKKSMYKVTYELAEVAMGTFLRLLMKLMTPSLFVSKLPTIWERDHRSGKLAADGADLANKHLVITLSDVAGYDYLGPGLEGFMAAPLSSMGCKNIRYEGDWTIEDPGPERFTGHFWWD